MLKNLYSSKIYRTILNFFDLFILIVLILLLAVQFLNIITTISNYILTYFNCTDSLFEIMRCMVTEQSGVSESFKKEVSTTTTTIIREEGGWSNAIRSLFIYGTGAYCLSLIRNGGSPSSRFVIAVTTVVGDLLTRVVIHTINDPNYVLNHLKIWKIIISNDQTSAECEIDANTTSILNEASNAKFIGDGVNWDQLAEAILEPIFKNLNLILAPVKVDYSNEVLATQINHLSILMFILGVIILFMIFFINVIIF